MPFTISHAAVVLPFSRLLARWRVLSACVIGAMVPDFGLFSPWRPGRAETHGAFALLAFCLPVGLATYWLFEKLVKTPILEVLPEGAYARTRPYASPGSLASPDQWLRAAGGVLAGAVTHLVWDGFSHEGARGVRMFPALDDPLLEIGNRHLDAVRLMQDLGSLVGLAVVLALLMFALRRGRQAPIPSRPLSVGERRYWVLAYGVAVIALSAAFYWRTRLGQPPSRSIVAHTAEAAVASLRGLATALLGVSLVLGARLRALRQRSSGPER